MFFERHHRETKRYITEWEKMFATQITSISRVTRIYKEVLQINTQGHTSVPVTDGLPLGPQFPVPPPVADLTSAWPTSSVPGRANRGSWRSRPGETGPVSSWISRSWGAEGQWPLAGSLGLGQPLRPHLYRRPRSESQPRLWEA